MSKQPPAIEQTCIRCAWCVDVCPVSLLPQQLLHFSRNHQPEQLEQQRLSDCIECAACDAVCPSHIPLSQYFHQAKQTLLEAAAAQEKAMLAKQRFEARNARIERIEQERLQRRKLRQEKAQQRAQNQSHAIDPVQAALAAAKQRKQAATIEDPVQAAIKQAQQRKVEANKPIEHHYEQAQKNLSDVELLQQRIATLQQKIDEKEEGPARKVMQSSLVKMQALLDKLQQEGRQ